MRLTGLVLLAAACGSPGPRPLGFGSEQCAHCHMTLADPRFAAEVVTTTGKVIPFDDVGCLAAFVATGVVPRDRIASIWVEDFSGSGPMLEAGAAVFLLSDSLHTPMDYRIVGLPPGRSADSLRTATGGQLLSWEQVVRKVGDLAGR